MRRNTIAEQARPALFRISINGERSAGAVHDTGRDLGTVEDASGAAVPTRS